MALGEIIHHYIDVDLFAGGASAKDLDPLCKRKGIVYKGMMPRTYNAYVLDPKHRRICKQCYRKAGVKLTEVRTD